MLPRCLSTKENGQQNQKKKKKKKKKKKNTLQVLLNILANFNQTSQEYC